MLWLLIVCSFCVLSLRYSFKHVRGHPSGPKISRSHPDCLLVTSSGRNIRLLTCTFILLARRRCASFGQLRDVGSRQLPIAPSRIAPDHVAGCPLDLFLAPNPADQHNHFPADQHDHLPVPAPPPVHTKVHQWALGADGICKLPLQSPEMPMWARAKSSLTGSFGSMVDSALVNAIASFRLARPF